MSTKQHHNETIIIALIIGLVLTLSTVFLLRQKPELNPFYDQKTSDNKKNEQKNKDEKIKIEVKTIAERLDHPWDIKISENETVFFTQRGSGLYKLSNNSVISVYEPDDLYPAGEGGMLGFDLSPEFSTDREVYTCFNSKTDDGEPQVILSKLKLNENLTGIENREDIVTEIPSSTTGRHSGCRARFDPNNQNVIWVTTGDAADGHNPQDPKSLGGKVLRVNREGEGVDGNLEEPFDPRIFSYGHRNIQGITLFKEYNETYGYGFTAEHGPDVDDEINPILKGNFGWDPNLPYDESVPMTDREKFPDAIEAVWSSGNRTIAACGIEYIQNEKWGSWKGDLLLAVLKDRYILRFEVEDKGEVSRIEEVINDYGRIRQVYENPEGDIYFTTDNGGDDIIGKITSQ